MDTIKKAFQLMEDKQTDEALLLLENYLPETNDDQKFTIGELYWQWGFLQEARNIFIKLHQQYPEESEINILLADIYIELDNGKDAINILDSIKENDPSYIQSLLQLADLYQSQGLFEVAEQKLLTAKQLQPNEPIIDFALGEFFFSTGEFKRSILYYENLLQVQEEFADVSIPIRLAEANAASGEYEKALELFNNIKSEDPDLLFKYGVTAYQAKRPDIAIKAWEKLVEYDPNYHTVYYELSKAYHVEGLVKEAYDMIEKGLKMDEFNKELYFYAGVLANELDKPTESEKMLREAIVLDSDYKEAILFLVKLLEAQGNYSDIIELIEGIKELSAFDPLYEWELAKAYNESEQYESALSSYREAFISLNDDSEFLKEFGYYLTEDGKVEEAIPVIRKYLQYEPTDVETEEYLDRLIQPNE